ncbi:hypothetical protein [Nostoc sp. WHI]|nr:hypothetical protein [Nostoc sp. WHI]
MIWITNPTIIHRQVGLEREQRDFVKSDQKQAMPSAGCAYAKNDI